MNQCGYTPKKWNFSEKNQQVACVIIFSWYKKTSEKNQLKINLVVEHLCVLPLSTGVEFFAI